MVEGCAGLMGGWIGVKGEGSSGIEKKGFHTGDMKYFHFHIFAATTLRVLYYLQVYDRCYKSTIEILHRLYFHLSCYKSTINNFVSLPSILYVLHHLLRKDYERGHKK